MERKELEGRQWRELSIEHPLQADDISCGVFVLKVKHLSLTCFALRKLQLSH